MQQSSDGGQLSRAARHLIQCHDARAVTVANERAVFLEQCGEQVGATTWRKIAELVHTIEAARKPSPASHRPRIDEHSIGVLSPAPTSSPGEVAS